MKERPILFNADMVRAVLDGRKMQTRRIVKWRGLDEGLNLQFSGLRAIKEAKGWVVESQSRTSSEWRCQPTPCPFGDIGDRLWVRETWSVVSHAFDDDGLMIDYVPDRSAKAVHEKPFGRGYYSGHAIYAADGGFTWGDDDGCVDGRSCWKPSIHMSRWASRITLEITDVRVERLQDISETDALAEGVISEPCDHARRSCDEIGCCGDTAKGEFGALWKSIYGDDNWQANPWVWVVEFKRVESE
jgi:hypothetical protein